MGGNHHSASNKHLEHQSKIDLAQRMKGGMSQDASSGATMRGAKAHG